MSILAGFKSTEHSALEKRSHVAVTPVAVKA